MDDELTTYVTLIHGSIDNLVMDKIPSTVIDKAYKQNYRELFKKECSAEPNTEIVRNHLAQLYEQPVHKNYQQKYKIIVWNCLLDYYKDKI